MNRQRLTAKTSVAGNLLSACRMLIFLFFVLVCCLAKGVDIHHSGHADGEPSTVDLQQDLKVAFSLLDRNMNEVSLESYDGQYVLLTFGFVHCAHICPTIASTMAQVMRESNKDVAAVFVSVDTERDSPVVVDNYARMFHPEMVGLGGSYSHIEQAANNFGVKYTVIKTQNSFSVQHTTYTYLIGPDGELIEIFTMDAGAEAILDHLS